MFPVILISPTWFVSRYQCWIFLSTTLNTVINYIELPFIVTLIKSSLVQKSLAYNAEKLFYVLCVFLSYVYAIAVVPFLARVASSEIIKNTGVVILSQICKD